MAGDVNHCNTALVLESASKASSRHATRRLLTLVSSRIVEGKSSDVTAPEASMYISLARTYTEVHSRMC